MYPDDGIFKKFDLNPSSCKTKISGSRDGIASKKSTWRLLRLCLMRNFDPNLSTEAPWTQLIKTLLQSLDDK